MRRYVVYKGSGGMIHMLGGLVKCIHWCIKHKHFLIIDVKGHLCFQHYLSEFFEIRNFTNYSEDYNIIEPNLKFRRLSLDTIQKAIIYHIDNKEKKNYILEGVNIRVDLDKYNMNDMIKLFAGTGSGIYHMIPYYIKVKPDILDKIYNYKQITDKYIGVHFRNTDIKTNINELIGRLKNINCNTIYLATDDIYAFDIIQKELQNKIIIQYSKPFDGNGKPIHYTEPDKYKLILNLLVDIYFLYKADEFISSNGSLVSNLINIMRNNKINIFE
jgi:hypothetical protein